MTISPPSIRVGSRPARRSREYLRVYRCLMVLSSIAPLFVLWGISGIDLFPWWCVAIPAFSLAVLPTIGLFAREKIAVRDGDTAVLTIGTSEDRRGDIIAYLLALLLPFYREAIDSWPEFVAMAVALIVIVFLFYRLNFHYINLVFAIRGYRVFMVHPPPGDSDYGSVQSVTLITQRGGLRPNDKIVAYRISDTVYIEKLS